jgi:hypothetical protein
MTEKLRQDLKIEARPHIIGLFIVVLLSGAGTSAAAQAGPVCWKHLSTATGDIPLPAAGSGELGQAASLVLDIDKDGINDFVIVVWHSSQTVAWYRHVPGGWAKYVIENSSAIQLEAGGAFFDIDGDGDLDVVFGDLSGNQIYWWENPYPNYAPNTPWTRHLIRNTGSSNYHDMMFGDFNGDGQTEFVSWNSQTALLFFTIPANPRTSGVWPTAQIYSSGGTLCEGLAAADINLDGKIDIVGAGLWFEHAGGTNFTPHLIAAGMGSTRCAVGQLIADDRPEVAFSPGDADGLFGWYQWNGSTWQAHSLLANVRHGHSLSLADFNGDGNLDIFTAEMGQWNNTVDNPNAKVRVMYGDGAGTFTEQVVMSGLDSHESKAADLNGDGKPDILGKPFLENIPRLDIWLNSPVGDLNNDCGVDMDDLSIYAVQWLNTGCAAALWCGGSDINNDDKVDFLDYAMLARNWLQTSVP